MTLTFGSLFAGVGGFGLGLERAGMTPAWQVEWDRHASAVLAHHWPTVERHTDVRTVTARPVDVLPTQRTDDNLRRGRGADHHGRIGAGDTEPTRGVLRPVDCITYGFPCQDLSVAGNRAGLDGDRSGLFFEAIRLIREMRDATNGTHPTWAVAENVPGLLSADDGTAMGRCLDELADAGALVVEWAVLDARWFGVPQRRRRVFIVACFDPATAARCPDPLLPVGPRGVRHPGSGDETGQVVAALTSTGVGTCGADDNQAQAGHLVPTCRAVRRLTPVETERLQGFPDDWTAGHADSHRYRFMGNAVAVPVAEWVARQIGRVHA